MTGKRTSNTSSSDNNRIYIGNLSFERQFLRSILLYGCYDLQDYRHAGGIFRFYSGDPARVGRTVRNERHRLNAILPDGYLKQNGRSITCSYDFSQGKNDSLLFIYALASCTLSYSNAYIRILSLLNCGPLSRQEIHNETAMMTGRGDIPSTDTTKKHLRALTDAGFLKMTGKDTYAIADDPLKDFTDDELCTLVQYLDFAADSFSFHVPFYDAARHIRLYLLDRNGMDLNSIPRDQLYNLHINYRRAHTFSQLDDDQVFKLLTAIHNHEMIALQLYEKKRYQEEKAGIDEDRRVLPLYIFDDAWTGRMTLICVNPDDLSPHQYRIDYINNITLLKKVPDEKWQKAEKAAERMNYAWSTFEDGGNELEEVQVRFLNIDAKPHILDRVKREKRQGEIIEQDDSTCTVRFLVTNAEDMIPWIRSYGENAAVLKPEKLRDRLQEDWHNAEGLMHGTRHFSPAQNIRDFMPSAVTGQVSAPKKKASDLSVYPPYENIRNDVLTAMWNLGFYEGGSVTQHQQSQLMKALIPPDFNFVDYLDVQPLMADRIIEGQEPENVLFIRCRGERNWRLNTVYCNAHSSVPIRLSLMEREAVVNALNMPQRRYFMDRDLRWKFLHAFADCHPSWSMGDIRPRNQWREEIWNPDYTENFTQIRQAMNDQCSISFRYRAIANPVYDGSTVEHGWPYMAEYSPNDDRMRLIIYTGNHTFNCMVIGRMEDVREDPPAEAPDLDSLYEKYRQENEKELIMDIQPSGFAVERIVRLFSWYEKSITADPDTSVYTMRLKYYVYDESALIRDILSCGDFVCVRGNEEIRAKVQTRIEAAAKLYP